MIGQDFVLFGVLCLVLWAGIEGIRILWTQYNGERTPQYREVGEWAPPGIGKVYPAGTSWTRGCGVCGVWTPLPTCGDCITWAEVQILHLEGQLPSFQLSLREHKRLIEAAGW